MQLALAAPVEPAVRPSPPPVPDGPLVLLTAAPLEAARRFTAAGWTVHAPGALPDDAGPRTVLIGASAAWQGEWRALSSAIGRATAVVDRCGHGDVRTLLGVTALLPPTGPDEAVLVPAEGPPVRVALPATRT